MARDPAVQGPVQTHNWRSCPCSKVAGVSLVAVFHGITWWCCQRKHPFPLLLEPAPHPRQAQEQQFLWNEVNWTGKLIQVYAKHNEKVKKKVIKNNSLLAASWLRVSLILELKACSSVAVSALQHLNNFILKVAVFHGWVFVLSCEYTAAINFKQSFWFGCVSSTRTRLKTWKVKIYSLKPWLTLPNRACLFRNAWTTWLPAEVNEKNGAPPEADFGLRYFFDLRVSFLGVLILLKPIISEILI